MIIKFILGVLAFLLVVFTIGAIYLGWEESEQRYNERRKRR